MEKNLTMRHPGTPVSLALGVNDVKLIDKLFTELNERDSFFIGIDGDLGAGKTTLAKMLSDTFSADCIHLDEFLNNCNGSYLQRLNYSAIKSILITKKYRLIIEGICLLSVLDRLKINSNYNVFVCASNESCHVDDLDRELIEYKLKYQPKMNANIVIEGREINMKTQHDVDILYIKSKTLFSSILALGGLLSIVVGGLLIGSDSNADNTAVIKLFGSEISAKGIGSVILCTSIAWAFLAYKARPIYQTKREKRIIKNNDGTTEEYENHSSTRAIFNNDK